MVFWKRSNKGGDIRDPPTPTSGGRPKLKAAFTEELQSSVRNLQESKEDKSNSLFGFLGGAAGMSPFRSARPKPRLSSEQQDELRASVHKMMERKGQRNGHNPPEEESAVKSRRPSLSHAMVDEIRTSFHNRKAGKNFGRPSLSQAMSEELRSSFHKREAKNDSRRQQIKTRLMQRRESHRDMLYPHSIREEVVDEEEAERDSEDQATHEAQDTIAVKVPTEGTRLRPELFDELRKSIHNKSTRNIDRRQQIRERIMKRREAQRVPYDASLHSTDSSYASFGDEDEQELFSDMQLKPPTGQKAKKKEKEQPKWDLSQHSTGSFQDASFSEFEATYHGNSNKPTASMPRKSQRVDEGTHVSRGDSGYHNPESARLLRENKKLKSEATLNQKKMSVLTQEVEDLRAEGTDLRKQLSSWQQKVSTISTKQSQERQKFGKSTDLIAKARVELTKTLNENSSLKSKLYEMEAGADERERRIDALNETVESQSQKTQLMSSQLKDTEAELRYMVDEKRRMEEELAVVVASRDGADVGETIRRLEGEKAQWLEEKERTLEAKRIALDEENDKMLEREKNRYRQEADQLTEMSEKSRKREEEHNRLQQAINKQLKEMKDANQELRDKLQNEHMENRVENKKKDHTIAMLEQEVSKLRRKLAASQLREQEVEARFSEMDDTSDELRDAKKQNSLLEKKIKKLQSEKGEKKQNQNSQDWKEIVLPGYKNLRGVTFGAPSEELAGFLTILVEDQKAKQAEALSRLQESVMEEYFRERDSLVGVPSKWASKQDKSANTGKSSKRKQAVQKKNTYDFTDIEDYDWAIKPEKLKGKSSNQMQRGDRYTDEKKLQHKAPKAKSKKAKKYTTNAKAKPKEKGKSADKKYSRMKLKNTSRAKSTGRRLSRQANFDDNLATTKMIERKTGRGAQMDPDDISLLVMKRPHNHSKPVEANKKSRPIHRRGRLPPVTPPAMIVLQ